MRAVEPTERLTIAAASNGPELLELFRRAGADSPSGALWGDPASEAEVYLAPYLNQATGRVLVAAVGDEMVGYLAGCSDTAAFPSEADRIDEALRNAPQIWRRRLVLRFFARATTDTVTDRLLRRPKPEELADDRWPAHLHVNVVREFRGHGVGDELMSSWLAHLSERHVPGCHLQTLAENRRAVAFFERWGFRSYGDLAPVPGVRVGRRRAHQLTMVREVTPVSEESSPPVSIGPNAVRRVDVSRTPAVRDETPRVSQHQRQECT